MKKAEIQVGKKYVMKVSGKLVPVLVSRTCAHGGWYGVNTATGREVRIRTAAKLRKEYIKAVPPPTKPAPIDELCHCGHMRSQHGDTVAKGHGVCNNAKCFCSKFTWKEFVYPSRALSAASQSSQAV